MLNISQDRVFLSPILKQSADCFAVSNLAKIARNGIVRHSALLLGNRFNIIVINFDVTDTQPCCLSSGKDDRSSVTKRKKFKACTKFRR